MLKSLRVIPGLQFGCLAALGAMLWSGCSARQHRLAADKEVYGIITRKEQKTLGKTNDFTINTPYSAREPDSIKSAEILADRLRSGPLKPSLSEALKLAVETSRNYQLRKETLYLTALALTRERYEFRPRLFAGLGGGRGRDGSGETGQASASAGVQQALKTSGSIGLNIVNDLFRYYSGDPRRSAVSTISLNLVQPLLRGAGRDIAAENLTQAERNVVYEIRGYGRFQNTFALDIISTYYRLLQQKDLVRNEYNNFQTLVLARERAEALGRDRLPEIQVDQARQDELSAKNRYVVAVQNFQTQLDQFKQTLGLPLGVELTLDDAALEELNKTGLIPVPIDEPRGYQIAVSNRLDLLNEIDRFEDSQRKIRVAANRLKADVNIVADASLRSNPPADYANFDFRNYQASAGLELNLPIDRLRERNDYRATLIAFERQLRSLALSLDEVRDDVRQGLRTIRRTRQSYEIQKNAVLLATKRVEGANLSLQAGTVQIRDLLEAQNSQVQARNALTQTLVDYHLARLRFLIDIGQLDTGADHFWLARTDAATTTANPENNPAEEVIPPEQLFGK